MASIRQVNVKQMRGAGWWLEGLGGRHARISSVSAAIPHPEERPLGRVSKDGAPPWFETRANRRAPHQGGGGGGARPEAGKLCIRIALSSRTSERSERRSGTHTPWSRAAADQRRWRELPGRWLCVPAFAGTTPFPRPGMPASTDSKSEPLRTCDMASPNAFIALHRRAPYVSKAAI